MKRNAKHILLFLTFLLLVGLLTSCRVGNLVATQREKLEEQGSKVQKKLADINEKMSSNALEYLVDKESGSVTIKGRGLCTSTDIVIPETWEGYPVTMIAPSAFLGDLVLRTDIIPNGYSGYFYTYYANGHLRSITIPKSIMSIGEEAFSDCGELESIIYQGTKAEWDKISKGSSWDNGTGDYTIHCTDGDIAK